MGVFRPEFELDGGGFALRDEVEYLGWGCHTLIFYTKVRSFWEMCKISLQYTTSELVAFTVKNAVNILLSIYRLASTTASGYLRHQCNVDRQKFTKSSYLP